mgnify:CR=1 FL=1|jgi:Domain of unknown function (DUF1849).
MHSSRTAIVATVAAVDICLSAMGARAAVAANLVPHRAVYDIELKEASERSGIEGLRGRLVFEFNGSECTGYTTNFRFVNRIDTGDEVRVTDQQSVLFEDLKTGRFDFESKSFTDDSLDKDVSGHASDLKEGVKIELTEPARRTVELASSQFPTEHMLDIIERARKGRTIFETRIFDGSEDGDRSYLTTIVVGNSQPPVTGDPEAQAVGDLAKSAYWPVSIAYFEEKGSGDQLPIYTQSFKLYENGITRDLTLDYGDFVLSGKLAKLEILGDGTCRQ